MSEPLVNKEQFRLFLFNLPKTEIHLHLEGLATIDTVWALIQRNKLNINGIKTIEDLRAHFNINSLEEFLSLYMNIIQNSFKTEDDLKYLIRDMERYLISNNIFYAEVFFAPSKFLQNGFDFAKMMAILDGGTKSIARDHHIYVKYLIDVSRSFGVDNAMHNLDLICKHRIRSIIGIGLGGSEIQGPAKDFVPVFEKARQMGLKTVAHAGEDVGPYSIWDAILLLGAQRIGHGTSAIKDPKLMEYLEEKQIPIEICPTSNIVTKKYVQTLNEHPIRAFFSHGLNVTLNTDDPTLFGTQLVGEYMNLIYNDLFSPGEILKIVKNTHFATFMSESEKETSWKTIQAAIDKSPFSISG
ncbi:MAG: adenosine deaminase [Spirochaetales bacterium]|jgi:adenosine deaminase|nr:adenosine deaminase [Spirochaetales bacterium]